MIAAPRSIPFGTKVVIEGRQYTVEDRTAKKYNGRWDIYTSSHKQALKNGIKHTNVIIK
jgi:3D (Asp-Asp-Asp) domain-containing protein